MRAKRLSLGGGIVTWGRTRERGGAPRVLRARARRLARLRDAPAPAVHGCGTSRTSRSAPPSRRTFHGPARRWRSSRSSSRSGSPRTRSTSCTDGRCGRGSRPPCSSRSRSPRSAGACAIGIYGARELPWLLAFVATGVVIVVGYNLELAGMHTDWVLVLGVGPFAVLTGAFAQQERITPAAVIAAAAAAALALTQRRLSTFVRHVRRDADDAHAELVSAVRRRAPRPRAAARAGRDGAPPAQRHDRAVCGRASRPPRLGGAHAQLPLPDRRRRHDRRRRLQGDPRARPRRLDRRSSATSRIRPTRGRRSRRRSGRARTRSTIWRGTADARRRPAARPRGSSRSTSARSDGDRRPRRDLRATRSCCSRPAAARAGCRSAATTSSTSARSTTTGGCARSPRRAPASS